MLLKKILILIPWFHPAYKAGGPIRSIDNMLHAFEEEAEIEFYIFCSNRDLDHSILQVQADCWNQYTKNSRVWYSAANAGDSMKEEVSNIKPDLFFIVGIYDQAYNFKPLLQWKQIPKIISVRGMLHPGALAQKTVKKRFYLQLWKLLRIHKKNIFHATSEQEKEFIEACFGKTTDIRVAENFSASMGFQKPFSKQTGHLKMCTIALISPMKNHLAVLQVLMDISRDYKIEYDIYGPVKDRVYWSQCETLIKQMPAHVRVQYHGDIPPDKIIQVLSQTHIVVQPSESENYGHALYEALLAGRPVITSETTPWNKLLENQAGINMNPHNQEALKNAIMHFGRMTEGEYSICCNAAHAYAQEAVNGAAIKEQYRRLFTVN